MNMNMNMNMAVSIMCFQKEIPVHYYCNSKLSIKPNMFIADINLEENLRFIYDGNRFNPISDFNIELYKSWYN